MAKRKKGKTVKMTSPESYIRQRARTLPIHECRINSEWEENGTAIIAVARKHTNGNFTVGLFLVDLLCLGVKDAQYFFNIYPSEYKELIEYREEIADMIPVGYELIHNIVYAGIEFAEDYGFKPHKDFSVAQYILEEDSDDIEFLEINCGSKGKPFYVRGPLDSDLKFNQVIAQLEKTAGRGNYGFANRQPDEDWDEDWDEEWDDDIEEDDFMNDDFLDDGLWDEFPDDPFDVELDFNEKDIQNSSVFQFKIQIKDTSKPPVWRRVTIPSYFNFLQFHYIIQIIFGWTNSHLYQFSEKFFGSKSVITTIYDDHEVGDEQQIAAAEVLLSHIFNIENQRYTYTYDFGDSWEHQIILEKIIPGVAHGVRLLEGKGACPPEDCGGVWGYGNLKKIMEDKSHPEHMEYREWLGLERKEFWNPNSFDVEETQNVLNNLFGGETF